MSLRARTLLLTKEAHFCVADADLLDFFPPLICLMKNSGISHYLRLLPECGRILIFKTKGHRDLRII